MTRHLFFFFNDTATTEIYTLSLHDALPISPRAAGCAAPTTRSIAANASADRDAARSEEHTSELQSQSNLVCRLLLEKKKVRFVALAPHQHVGRYASVPDHAGTPILVVHFSH